MNRLDRLTTLQGSLKGMLVQWPGKNFEEKRRGFIDFFIRERLPTIDLSSAQNIEELYNIAYEILRAEILFLKEGIKTRELALISRYREMDPVFFKKIEEMAQDLIAKRSVRLSGKGDKEIVLARALIKRGIPRRVAFLAAVKVVGKLDRKRAGK